MAATYKACAKYLMVSPSKVRPVANLVRGKSYEEAYGILNAMPQKGPTSKDMSERRWS